ncbi:MAG: ubiquinol-cytochrome C chaperone [Alphaproteobacteria bacterium]|jgi:cytochrome b pre-mRNA-processing protein 3|nr:ubiquinol-cytochrome C chaperone [Alphaproteobacteria bacterium]
MLSRIRDRQARRKQALQLHELIVEQSRVPVFYTDLGVPDTMLGRYEMVCLHAYLVLTRLKRDGEARLAQTLHDLIFDDFDVALREAGLGDMGIGHRIKKLARNLHGRISVYESGIAGADAEMATILRRNMYASVEPTEEQVTAMITYVRAARAAMDAGSSGVELLANGTAFVPPAARTGEAVG